MAFIPTIKETIADDGKQITIADITDTVDDGYIGDNAFANFNSRVITLKIWNGEDFIDVVTDISQPPGGLKEDEAIFDIVKDEIYEATMTLIRNADIPNPGDPEETSTVTIIFGVDVQLTICAVNAILETSKGCNCSETILIEELKKVLAVEGFRRAIEFGQFSAARQALENGNILCTDICNNVRNSNTN